MTFFKKIAISLSVYSIKAGPAMDIRRKQSVLSFAGGQLGFTRQKVKPMPLLDQTSGDATKKKRRKKRKKEANPASKVGKADAASATSVKAEKASKSSTKKRKRKAEDQVPENQESSSKISKSASAKAATKTKRKLRSYKRKILKKRRRKKESEEISAPASVNASNKVQSHKKEALSEESGHLAAISSKDALAPELLVSKKPPKSLKPKPKMLRVTEETVPAIMEMEGNLVPSDVTQEAETLNLNRQNVVTGFDGWMEEQIRHMLTQKQEAFCLETSAKVDELREQLPRLTRAEEDSWLVEVSPRSRSVCQMGMSCESIAMSKAKGVNPPLRLPCVQKDGFHEYGMCLLCLRNTATCTLLRLRMNRVSAIQDSCTQTHANLVNVNGEYMKKHCLPIRRDKYEGVVAPMVAHFHSGYVAKEKLGENNKRVRFWAQDGYTMPNVMPYDVHSEKVSKSTSSSSTSNKKPFLLSLPRTVAMH